MRRLSRTFAAAFGCCAFVLLSLSAQEKDGPQPVVVFNGHAEAVYSASFNKDGTIAVTGSFDKTARLWTVADGKVVREFGGTGGHTSLVLSATLNGNGDQLATGGSDNTAKVWDVPSAVPVKEFAHGAPVAAMAVSNDGKLAAGAGADGTVKVWQVADGKLVATIPGHTGGATGVAFSANGQTLATSGAEGRLRFWNTADGKAILAVGAHPGAVNGVAVNPGNGATYTIGGDGTLRFWQPNPVAAKVFPPAADAVTTITTAPSGNLTLVGSADKLLRLIDATSGQVTKSFLGATAAIRSSAFFPNGATVGAAMADGNVAFWNGADGKLLAMLPAHMGEATGIAVNAAGNGFATGGNDGIVRTWVFPVVPGKALVHADRVLHATMTADGKRAVTGGADKIVRIWNVATGAIEKQYAGHESAVNAAILSVDGQTLYSAGGDATIRIWNVASGKPTAILSGHTGPVNSLALAANGTQLISGGDDGSVKVWTLAVVAAVVHPNPVPVVAMVPSADLSKAWLLGNDKQWRQFTVGDPAVKKTLPLPATATAIAFSADGSTQAIASTDKSISIRSGDKETKKLTLTAEAKALAFLPNGQTLAVATADNAVRLLNLADGKESKNAPGHAAAITFLAATPKGDLLVSASADKTIRLWNAVDLAAKGKIDCPFVPAQVALNSTGTHVIAAADKAVQVWTIADGKPVATLTLPVNVAAVSVSADGQRLAVATADAKVRLHGVDGKLQEFLTLEAPATAVAWLADTKRVLTAGADKSLRLWTPANLATVNHAGPVRQVAMTPTLDLILMLGDDKQLRIWDAKTFKETKSIPIGATPAAGFALSADATKVAVAGGDKSIAIFTLADGKLLKSIPLAGPATAIAMTPTATRVAVSVTEGAVQKVRLYDAASGVLLQIVADGPGVVRSIGFLSDARTLYFAGDSKTLATTDTPVLNAFVAHPGGVVSIVVNPAANQAIAAGKDKTVKLWDLATGKEVKALATLPDAISALAASRDFAAFAVAAGKTVKAWQIADGKELATFVHPADVLSVAFNADRSLVLTGAADNQARVWDVKTGLQMQGVDHAGPVTAVAFHPTLPVLISGSADKSAVATPYALQRVVAVSAMPLRTLFVIAGGSHVLTGGDDKIVRFFNASNGTEERKFEGAEGAVLAVAVSKNNLVVAVASGDKKVRLFTYNDAKEAGVISLPANASAVAFTADAKSLITAGSDKTIAVWNVAFQPGQPLPDDFGKLIQDFRHGEAATAVAATDKGDLFSASLEKSLKQWKLASPTPTRSFQHPNLVDSVAWSPDGKLLATGGHDGFVRTFDVEKNAAAKAINAHATVQPPAPVYSVNWSPDGKQIASTSFDKSIKLWDAASGNLVREFKGYTAKTFEKGHQDQVFCAGFSKNGQQIASGSSDRRLKLWNVADGNVVREFANPNLKGEPGQSHPGGIYGVRFTPDDRYLVSVGPAPKNKGYLAIWSVADGKLAYSVELPYGPIYSVAISPDGSKLLLGCGPRMRQDPASEAIILAMPVK